MKTLLGVLLTTSLICVNAIAQERSDQRQPDRQAAPANPAWIETQIKSQAQILMPTSGDKTQAAPVNKRRKFELLSSSRSATSSPRIVMIDGAVYTTFGDMPIPMPGGGASGCFDPTGVETAARIERAKVVWAMSPKKD